MAGPGPNEPARAVPELGPMPVYVPSIVDSELRQGEILADVPQAYLAPEAVTLSTATPERTVVNFKLHPLALVMSQDCDLEQDYILRRKKSTDPTLPNVLLCELFEAARIEERMKEQKHEDIWRRVHQNQDSRYQYLRAVTSEQDSLGAGLPAMVVDFKRYFSIPTPELYSRLSLDTRRRCRLDGTYAQHVAQRFYSFHSRVALPIEHHR